MNLQPLLVVLGFCVAVMLGGWLVQQRRPNLAIADLLWTVCLSISALFYGVIAGGAMLPRLLVAMMGGVAGFRLFMHLLQRLLLEPAKAGRVVAPGSTRFGTLAFFLSKALSATAFSIPLYVAASNPQEQTTVWSILAAAVYIVGLAGETYADIQLTQFLDQPRNSGRACRRGLWRYSRHPNYFFAFVHWWSYALLAIGVPWSLWTLTLIAPALMAAIAWRRIPLVEAQALLTRGEDYAAYQRTTNMLLPWFPTAWPHDVAGAATWYTPPPPSRVAAATNARATPLPGARITPTPLTAGSSLNGPTTPRPDYILKQRAEAAARKKAKISEVDR